MTSQPHFFAYLGFRILAAMITRLPDRCFYGLASGLGRFAFHVLRIRRAVTLANLDQALGEAVSPAAKIRLAGQAYGHVAITMLEMLRVGRLQARLPDMVEIPDLAIIKEMLARRRGLIIVSCHCGSWEMVGPALSFRGISMSGVAATMSNSAIDRYVTDCRRAMGLEVLPLTASAKDLVRAIRQQRGIGLVSDQNGGINGVFVDFFGRSASTPRGAAQLALKFKTPMAILVCLRTRPGRYQGVVQEVVIRADDTVTTLTQRYTTMMEDIIRQHPEQYFWMHRRWKTRPEGENEG